MEEIYPFQWKCPKCYTKVVKMISKEDIILAREGGKNIEELREKFKCPNCGFVATDYSEGGKTDKGERNTILSSFNDDKFFNLNKDSGVLVEEKVSILIKDFFVILSKNAEKYKIRYLGLFDRAYFKDSVGFSIRKFEKYSVNGDVEPEDKLAELYFYKDCVQVVSKRNSSYNIVFKCILETTKEFAIKNKIKTQFKIASISSEVKELIRE